MEKILSPQIQLIIECCKIDKNEEMLKYKINQIDNWNEFISKSYIHGIFPLIYNSLKKYSKLIPDEVLQVMKYRNFDIAKDHMQKTCELLKVLKILEENEILAIPFKGPILSQMAYGDVISRQYVDIDILVEEKDLKKTIKLLLENNFINILPLEIISNKICLDVIKDFTMQNKNSKINIEIHWKLFEKKYDALFDVLDTNHIDSLEINANNLKTFSAEFLLVYLCYHGSKHAWERVEWIVDIDRLIRNNKINFSKIDFALEDNSFLIGLYLSNILFYTPLEKKYLEKISNEKTKKIAEKVYKIFDDKKYNNSNYYRNRKILDFQISLLNKFTDKIKQYLKMFFNISAEDCQTYHLSSKYGFMYLFLKPFRILKKYLKI